MKILLWLLLLTTKNGSTLATAEHAIDACIAAKVAAHRERCSLLAQDKSISACDCTQNDTSDWSCEVRYKNACRSYAAFTPVYMQTGTVKGTSNHSRKLACQAAKVHANVYVCRVDRFEKQISDCVCDVVEGTYTCLVDFKFWCY